jgi:hypothetical protein
MVSSPTTYTYVVQPQNKEYRRIWSHTWGKWSKHEAQSCTWGNQQMFMRNTHAPHMLGGAWLQTLQVCSHDIIVAQSQHQGQRWARKMTLPYGRFAQRWQSMGQVLDDESYWRCEDIIGRIYRRNGPARLVPVGAWLWILASQGIHERLQMSQVGICESSWWFWWWTTVMFGGHVKQEQWRLSTELVVGGRDAVAWAQSGKRWRRAHHTSLVPLPPSCKCMHCWLLSCILHHHHITVFSNLTLLFCLFLMSDLMY